MDGNSRFQCLMLICMYSRACVMPRPRLRFSKFEVRACAPECIDDTSVIAGQRRLHRTLLMALELHVWGPGFGLPSIDPECIATITYCQRVIPEGQWSLVASYDKSVGLTGVPYKHNSKYCG